MKKLAIIPIAAIALLSSSVLSAQEAKTKRADTLRRELTVMTEEEVSLSARQPVTSPIRCRLPTSALCVTPIWIRPSPSRCAPASHP